MKLVRCSCGNGEFEARADGYFCAECGEDIEELFDLGELEEGRCVGKTPTVDLVTLRLAA